MIHINGASILKLVTLNPTSFFQDLRRSSVEAAALMAFFIFTFSGFKSMSWIIRLNGCFQFLVQHLGTEMNSVFTKP